MSTLKVCAGRDHWITDVTRVEVVKQFTCPEGKEARTEKEWREYQDSVLAAGLEGARNVHMVNSVDFCGEQFGTLIAVWTRFQDGPVHWVVPARQCFLMADDGRTIDRI